MKRAVLGSILALTALAVASEAQEPLLLRGQVLDSESRAPVYGAFVVPTTSDRGVLTDTLGFFTLRIESTSGHVRVTQLGYHDLEVEVRPEARDMMLTVLLAPNPVLLEGLTVLMERFAERLRGTLGLGEILDREQLLNAPDASGYDLVLRLLPFAEPCGYGSLCLGLPGRNARKKVSVCVDDRRLPETMMELALGAVDPRALYVVEVYGRAGEVRMYSPDYMKRLIESGENLLPLTFGCRDERL
jgi:CarboxypepD_reg-like domain